MRKEFNCHVMAYSKCYDSGGASYGLSPQTVNPGAATALRIKNHISEHMSR